MEDVVTRVAAVGLRLSLLCDGGSGGKQDGGSGRSQKDGTKATTSRPLFVEPECGKGEDRGNEVQLSIATSVKKKKNLPSLPSSPSFSSSSTGSSRRENGLIFPDTDIIYKRVSSSSSSSPSSFSFSFIPPPSPHPAAPALLRAEEKPLLPTRLVLLVLASLLLTHSKCIQSLAREECVTKKKDSISSPFLYPPSSVASVLPRFRKATIT